jgi:hypothetical protein
MTSVLVFPLIALSLRRREERSSHLATEGTTSTP